MEKSAHVKVFSNSPNAKYRFHIGTTYSKLDSGCPLLLPNVIYLERFWLVTLLFWILSVLLGIKLLGWAKRQSDNNWKQNVFVLFPSEQQTAPISTALVEAASLLSLLTEAFGIFITAEDSMPWRVNLILRLPGSLLWMTVICPLWFLLSLTDYS